MRELRHDSDESDHIRLLKNVLSFRASRRILQFAMTAACYEKVAVQLGILRSIHCAVVLRKVHFCCLFYQLLLCPFPFSINF